MIGEKKYEIEGYLVDVKIEGNYYVLKSSDTRMPDFFAKIPKDLPDWEFFGKAKIAIGEHTGRSLMKRFRDVWATPIESARKKRDLAKLK
jgi:hypothetical protein